MKINRDLIDVATTTSNGLMSASDKQILDSIFEVPSTTVTNLNYVYAGAFKFGDNTNNAPVTTSGRILAFRLTNDNYIYQIVIPDYNISPWVRYRHYYGGSWIWSSWWRVQTDADFWKINFGLNDNSQNSFTADSYGVYIFMNTHIFRGYGILIMNHPTVGLKTVPMFGDAADIAKTTITKDGNTITIKVDTQCRGQLYKITAFTQ